MASGKGDRVVIKVNVELQKLEARLQYESTSAPSLALVSVEAVAVDLTVRPDTLHAIASLGNLRMQDGILPEVGVRDLSDSAKIAPDADLTWLDLPIQPASGRIAAETLLQFCAIRTGIRSLTASTCCAPASSCSSLSLCTAPDTSACWVTSEAFFA